MAGYDRSEVRVTGVERSGAAHATYIHTVHTWRLDFCRYRPGCDQITNQITNLKEHSYLMLLIVLIDTAPVSEAKEKKTFEVLLH